MLLLLIVPFKDLMITTLHHYDLLSSRLWLATYIFKKKNNFRHIDYTFSDAFFSPQLFLLHKFPDNPLVHMIINEIQFTR